MTGQLTTIPFHGASLIVRRGDTPETTMVAMKPVVEGMKLNWEGQRMKLARHPVLAACTIVTMVQIPGDDQAREHTFLPLHRFPFWLATLHPARFEDEHVRAMIVLYQNEAADALFHHFFGVPVSAAPTDLSAEVRKVIGGIVKSVVHAEMVNVIPQMVRAEISSATFALRRGKTAGQIWRDYRLPAIKSVSRWFGNRLEEVGCRIADNGCGELGLTKARLFDPDKVDSWMRNGGEMLARQKVAERQGQGVLRLVVAKSDPS